MQLLAAEGRGRMHAGAPDSTGTSGHQVPRKRVHATTGGDAFDVSGACFLEIEVRSHGIGSRFLMAHSLGGPRRAIRAAAGSACNCAAGS